MAVEIDLHIEEVLFVGCPGIDRERVRAALVDELTRLLLESEGVASTWHYREIDLVDGGTLRLTGMTPEAIGRQMALTILRSIQ
ncbi:hypothetical protein [Chloroflexus sp.]|uniref:hypothetical protein n=1 Tax=Chloroflexus sp. TaxID=1904827 RepID=UPI002ADDC4C2|nr:hypothetical protein [Chloroflexus sp.]